MPTINDITLNQRRAVEALPTARRLKEAAHTLGINPRMFGKQRDRDGMVSKPDGIGSGDRFQAWPGALLAFGRCIKCISARQGVCYCGARVERFLTELRRFGWGNSHPIGHGAGDVIRSAT